MDLTRLDHSGASTDIHHGREVDIDGWKVRMRPLSLTRNREWMVLIQGLPTDTRERGEVLEKQLVSYLVESVVLDWHGLTSGGEPVPYSAENARVIFEGHPAMAQAVFGAAADLGREYDAALEQEGERLGNSQPGGTNGASTSSSSSDAQPPGNPSPPSTVDLNSRRPSNSHGSAGAT